jgi:hypothetical protein
MKNGKESSGKAYLFNILTIGAMDRTSGQPQAELILLRSIEVNDFFSTSDI